MWFPSKRNKTYDDLCNDLWNSSFGSYFYSTKLDSEWVHSPEFDVKCKELGLEHEVRTYPDRIEYAFNVLFYEKENVRVEIDRHTNRVMISAERRLKRDPGIRETETKRETISLEGFDNKNVNAVYTNGLLVVTLFFVEKLKESPTGIVPVEITYEE